MEDKVERSNTPGTSVAPLHRQGTRSKRVRLMRACPYEMSAFVGQESIEFHQGEALSINISSGGMLLFMAQTPAVKQVFEIQVPEAINKDNATTVVEVCWTRQIPLEDQNSMHLVGVRFLFASHFSCREVVLAQKG